MEILIFLIWGKHLLDWGQFHRNSLKQRVKKTILWYIFLMLTWVSPRGWIIKQIKAEVFYFALCLSLLASFVRGKLMLFMPDDTIVPLKRLQWFLNAYRISNYETTEQDISKCDSSFLFNIMLFVSPVKPYSGHQITHVLWTKHHLPDWAAFICLSAFKAQNKYTWFLPRWINHSLLCEAKPHYWNHQYNKFVLI